MNYLSIAESIKGLVDGAFDRNPLKMAFSFAQNMPRGSYFNYYGKSNQRRHRKEQRRTIFANRHIKRGF